MTVQFGGRVNWAWFTPEGGLPDRDFTDGSASVGILFKPAAANDKLTFAFNLARAARNPALEELYFFGTHPGNFAFEIGNPELDSEIALGFDASVRWRHRRFSGEVTYFRNSIDDYIFREPDERRGIRRALPGRRAGRVPLRGGGRARQSLQGVEAHADIDLGGGFIAELGFDLVRAELRETNEPLPRIPPTRFIGGLRYQRNAFQAGGEIVAGGEAGPRVRRGNADRRLQPVEAVRVVLVRRREARSTRSRRGSTTRPTSSTATTCRSSRISCPRWGATSRWCIR